MASKWHARMQEWLLQKRWRVVLVVGVFMYGGMTLGLSFVWDYLEDGHPWSTKIVIERAIIWSIGGFVFGWLMWNMGKRNRSRMGSDSDGKAP